LSRKSESGNASIVRAMKNRLCAESGKTIITGMVNNKIKVSVVIPYFKRKELLVKTLLSLNSQKHMRGEFETIVVNDGSDDLEEAELGSLDLDIRLKYLKYERSEYSGPSFARNRGMEKAAGGIVLFLDCDLLVGDDFVLQHYLFHQNVAPGCEILQIGTRAYLGKTVRHDLSDLKQEDVYPDYRHRIFARYSQNLAMIRIAWHLAFSNNVSIRKSVLDRTGGFDEKFVGWGLEDCEFGYRLRKAGVKICFNPNIDIFHQLHETADEAFLFDRWKKNLDYFIAKHPDLPVMLQTLLCDVYDPQRFHKLEAEGLGEPGSVWLYTIERFEDALRCVEGKYPDTREKKFLVDPDLGALKKILPEKRPVQYVVICSKSDLALIAWLQTDPLGENVMLFSH
jgi:glycosyltransferase involved in cell wall biosynthesis